MDFYHRNTGAITDTPGLSLVPKLTFEHIQLTSFSKMRVDSTADVWLLLCSVYVLMYSLQVLSELVHKALVLTGGEEAQGTAEFVMMFDWFLTASMCHHILLEKQRKPFQDPYWSPADFRLKVSVNATPTVNDTNNVVCTVGPPHNSEE